MRRTSAYLQPSPCDAADGIIEAFRSHSVVAMGEGVGHGHEQGHAFLRMLIRDPRFARVANDIVVEWGNSLYQDVIDRFTRGEGVPYGELRKVWENTTQPHPVWDSSVYREFFETARLQNESLERAGISVFNAWGVPADVAAQVQPEVAAWSPMRWALIEDTQLGAAQFQKYFPGGDAASMQEQFDALMIYGALSTLTWSSLSPELCRDEEWIEMRVSRLQYDRQEFLRRYCEPAN